MLLGFFEQLRRYRVPVSIREFLDLLTLLERRLIFADLDRFYFLSKLVLVKDEKFYDRFDQAFAAYFSGLDEWLGIFSDAGDVEDLLLEELGEQDRPEAQLILKRYRQALIAFVEAKQAESAGEQDQPLKHESGEGASSGEVCEKAVEEGFEESVEEASEESTGEGSGGEGAGKGEGADDSGDSGEDGDSGDSGDGDTGRDGEGDDGRQGRGVSKDAISGERDKETDEPQQRAAKVWLDRAFEDYDPDVELGTRNLKMALRRLRRWARDAADLELDLPGTISSTAANGGLLDIRQIPERRNAVKVLMLFDAGGSMDEHIALCAQLFSAASSEFKHLEFYYFHNFIYEKVWRENARRQEQQVSVWPLLQRIPRDYKVIFVGDADMGRHEILERGGSVEHFNAEPGEVWMSRVQEHFRSVIWLNPLPPARWADSPSIALTRRLLDNHMYFLSDTGLAEAMKQLAK